MRCQSYLASADQGFSTRKNNGLVSLYFCPYLLRITDTWCLGLHTSGCTNGLGNRAINLSSTDGCEHLENVLIPMLKEEDHELRAKVISFIRECGEVRRLTEDVGSAAAGSEEEEEEVVVAAATEEDGIVGQAETSCNLKRSRSDALPLKKKLQTSGLDQK